MTRARLIGCALIVVAMLGLGVALGRAWAQRGQPPVVEQIARSGIHYGAHPSLQALSKARQPVVMLGDSLTGGAPWNELTTCPNVVSRGVWGDTSADVLARTDGVLALDPPAVFLMIGTNDVLRGVGVDAVVRNVKQSVEKMRGVNVYVHQVVPLGAQWPNGAALNETIGRLNAALAKELAPMPGVQIVDVRKDFGDQAGFLRPALSLDGVHLTAAAYALWRDRIEAEVLRHCRPQGNRAP